MALIVHGKSLGVDGNLQFGHLQCAIDVPLGYRHIYMTLWGNENVKKSVLNQL